MQHQPENEIIDTLIDLALEEDFARQDITSASIIPEKLVAEACILAKESGVISGLDICCRVFTRLDPGLVVKPMCSEGSHVNPGDRVVTISGNARAILSAERTALNFLSWLSGVASLTALFSSRVQGTGCLIKDTRKTTPGFRILQKRAVKAGGGINHRMHLADGLLIKDNHLAALTRPGTGISEAVTKARQACSGSTIEVEVNAPEEAVEAARAGAGIIMLDNMSLEDMRRVTRQLSGKVVLEASGGITLENVREVAQTGVDYISIGALTHSAKALDFSLEIL